MLSKAAKPKEVKPTFDIQVVDTATSSVIFKNNAEVDVFKEDLKEQLISGALSGGSILGAGALNLSPITSMFKKSSAKIQNAIKENAPSLEAYAAANEEDEDDDSTSASPAEIATEAPEEKPSASETVQAAENDSEFASLMTRRDIPPSQSPDVASAPDGLVRQPAYHRMSFYVFKPENIPDEYYVTYDGYCVYMDGQGVWYYASYDNGTITDTGYVVGSVIPSVIKLKPYTVKTAKRVSVGALSPAKVEQSEAEWLKDSKFTAIKNWGGTVDRIGVLDRQNIPAAWKGDYPEVIYAWTGARWRQLSARGKNIPALSTIRRNLYELAVEYNQSGGHRWTENDTKVLESLAGKWGFKWLGVISTRKAY